MGVPTEANRKLDKLEEQMKTLLDQVDECSSLLNDVVSHNTEGASRWNDNFRDKVFCTQKSFLEFTNCIHNFLHN